jgi:hypothetical protein
MAGVAYGQNSDLDENLLHVEAAYFIYPWLVAQVDFDDNSADDGSDIGAGIRAFPRANVYIDFAYGTSTADDATSEFEIEASIGF